MKQLTIRHFPALSYAGQEAFNTLCTNLSLCGDSAKKIMLTSCHGAEGKSFAAMNLLRTLAQHGKSVALVDADMRQSSLAADYGIHFPQEEHLGLAHLLSGDASKDDVIYRTHIQGAYMVPVGKVVSTPTALLQSPKFTNLLTYLAKQCDYVLIDTPPMGAVIDAAEIARFCDGILVVVDYDRVHRQELVEVKQQLERTGCPVLGTIINRVARKGFFGRRYYRRAYCSGYNDASNNKMKHQHGKTSQEEHHAPCQSTETTAP